ncbi:MAG: metal ABC transporter substrate-binding protein [Pseudanabaenaceae cyanobacterium]
MNRRLGLGLVAIALAGCGGPTPTTEGPAAPSAAKPTLSVVATSAVLCDLVKTVGAADVDLSCLMAPGVDPHTYQPTPADKQAIETAAVVFRNGYNFEPAIDQAVAGAKGTVVAVAEVAVPKPLMVAPHSHDHDHGHDHHHSHDHDADKEKADRVPDPHVWQNPTYGAAMAEAIARTLAQAQPEQAELFQQRATALSQQLAQLQTWQQAQCATIPQAQRVLVTTHHAMGYFAQVCGLRALSLAAVSTTDTLSPAQMTEVIAEIRENRVPILFAEATVGVPWLTQVGREAGVPVAEQPLYTDTVGKAGSGAETYVAMLAANVKTVVTGLGGQVTAFPGQAGD